MSERVRIFAAVGLVAALTLGGGFLLLGRGSASGASVPEVAPLHHARKNLAARVTAKRAVKRPAKPVAARPRRATVIDGMPAGLARALRSHDVVVVSLYTPGATVDAMATQEARAGASLAGAGFVALNVGDEKVAAPLASLLTAAPTPADRVPDGPATLVFQRPKALFVRFNGFVDRDTVAQAAANASTVSQ